MTDHRVWCNQCGGYQMHSFDYERDINGTTVTVTCHKCGYQVVNYKGYDR